MVVHSEEGDRLVRRGEIPDPGMPEMAIRSLSFGGRAWYLAVV